MCLPISKRRRKQNPFCMIIISYIGSLMSHLLVCSFSFISYESGFHRDANGEFHPKIVKFARIVILSLNGNIQRLNLHIHSIKSDGVIIDHIAFRYLCAWQFVWMPFSIHSIKAQSTDKNCIYIY